MRQVVLQFWVSVDGYSCDEGTELFRLMEGISDHEQEAHFATALRRAGTHIWAAVPTWAWLRPGPNPTILSRRR